MNVVGGANVGVVRWGKRENPQQESWIALQAAIAETLQRRVVGEGETITTNQEADFLAESIADDLMRLAPLVPPEHWVPRDER